MRLRRAVTASVATILTSCGAPAAPQVLLAPPATYLLGIDQLVSPDFTVDTAPHPLAALDISGAGGAASLQLKRAGFVAAAAEEFFRVAGSLALVNGPVQVRDTVEEFSSGAAAAARYIADVARLDAVPGTAAVSTGSLGDAAHAVTRTATSPEGVTAVEITVEWRLLNVLDVLVVRGRRGGTRLDDALVLAHRQTITELGLSRAAPASRS